MPNPTQRKRPARGLTLVAILVLAAISSGVAIAASGVSSGDRTLAAAPANTSLPTVNGTLTQGATLTASPGAWTTDAPPLTFAYQWFRCNASGNSCSPIASATQASYTLDAADVDHTIRVQVTASDSAGSFSSAATSPPTDDTIRAAEAPNAGPGNLVLPVAAGDTVQGSTLTAYTGQWSGFPVPTFTFLWQRCNPSGGDCNPIPGETSQTHTLTAPDVATTLKVQVTATSSAGTESVSSAATTIVTVPLGPVSTQPPAISGTAKVGETLTASNGQWSGAEPFTFTYRWKRCDAQGQGCQPIAGATQQTYVPQAADIGSRLVVEVTAANGSGTAAATSAPTAAVTGAPAGATIPVSQVSLPSRLVVSGVDFEPNVIRSRAPFTARFRVADTEGHHVSGAEVFLVGIPFGRFQPVGTVRTDQSGWATFTLQPTAKLPLRKGYLITIFVRAAKPGDELLAGVSTRRLVSVRINPS